MKTLIFLILSVAPSVIRGDNDCDIISACAGFQHYKIKNENEDTNKPYPAYEKEIPRQGHWNGIKPIHYKVDLNFKNQTNYNGSTSILFKVVAPVTQFMVNQHVQNPEIDYRKITIRKQCATAPPASPRPKTNCIKSVTFDEVNRTFTIDFEGTPLQVGGEYLINFPSFSGKSLSEDQDSGGIGLQRARVGRGEREDAKNGFVASTTLFQMRYARTIFPCFDQPALKAIFSLCVQVPDKIDVASNTLPLAGFPKNVGSNRKTVCFEDTTIIPTYIFTLALMQNYALVKIPGPKGGPNLEMYTPKGLESQTQWILNETLPTFTYLQSIAKFKYPLKRLAYVIQYPAPFWGVENFGLVTLDGAFIESKGDTAYVIVHHELVHQWLGNVVTIGHWGEICLQEGMTAYIEWVITSRRANTSLTAKLYGDGLSTDQSTSDYYEPDGLKDYILTKDIADTCFGRPPVFFHSVAAAFGFGAIENLLAKLVEKKPFGTATIDVYDEALSDVTNGSLKNYFTGWFHQPGPLYLLVTKVPQSDCVLIRQQLYAKETHEQISTEPRPVPVQLQVLGPAPSTKLLILNDPETRACGYSGLPNSGVLVDPESNTYTRKAYHLENYRLILKSQKQDPNTLTQSQLRFFLNNFCKSLLNDALPLPDDAAKASDWLEIYEMVLDSGVKLGNCACCLNETYRDPHDFINQCRYMGCGSLRLSKVVGLNFNKKSAPDDAENDNPEL